MKKLAGELKDNDDRNQEIVLKILQVHTVGGMYVCTYMCTTYMYPEGDIHVLSTGVIHTLPSLQFLMKEWGRELNSRSEAEKRSMQVGDG